MLEWLPGGYWDNEAVKRPEALVPMVLYRGDADGVPTRVVPGRSPAPACSFLWLHSPFPIWLFTKCPHVDHFGPEPVSAQTFTSSCLLSVVIPSGVPFPQ